MGVENYKNIPCPELLNLANIYYTEYHDNKSKEMLLVLFDRIPDDRDVLLLLSNVAESELDFKSGIQYMELLIPYSHDIDLYGLYHNLSISYLTQDIDESIKYLKKAITLAEEEQSISKTLGNYELSNSYDKLDFFTHLKTLIDDKNPIEYYKAIINNDKYPTDEVKQFLYNEYKNKYSSKYPDDFKKLKAIYDKKVVPSLQD